MHTKNHTVVQTTRPYLAIALLAVLLLLMAFVGVAQAVSYNSQEAELVRLINEYRVSQGLQPLQVSDALSEAGDRHSADMGKYRFFSHTTVASDWFDAGAAPWDRMNETGYGYNVYRGENIAAGQATAAEAFASWKASASHDANLLSDKYAVMGVSLVMVSGSPYGWYWTTDFGGYVDPTSHYVGSTQPPAPPVTTPLPVPTTTSPVTPPPPASGAGPGTMPASGDSFSDVSATTPYYAAIVSLADRGIVQGFSDGTFRAGDPVSRQQLAKMICLAMGYDVSVLTSCSFADVVASYDSAEPLYPRAYIAACLANGVVEGKTAWTFAPSDPVLRAQLITMVARAAKLPAASPIYRPPFDDFCPDHYPWALRASAAGLLDGLLGMGPGYDFWAPATRGEVCQMLAALLD